MEYNEQEIHGSPQYAEQPMPPNQGQQTIYPGGAQPGQETLQQPVTYFVDQATGQMYYGVAPQQSQMLNPIQPPNPAQYVLYAVPQQAAAQMTSPQQPTPQQGPSPDQGPAQETSPPDYSRLLQSVEDFAQGKASVSDVIKDFYTQTAQDDQFWKGAIVGAAAAALLNSEPVRQSIGKTFASLFAGIAGADAAAKSGKSGSQPGADE